jgi:protease-4
MMQDVYRLFTTKAAEGRHMPLEKLEALAGGQVYTGRVAKRIGLVDDLGTLKDALALAKQLAGIGTDEKTDLMILPEQKNPLDELFGIDTNDEKEVALMLGLKRFVPELTEPLRQALQFQRVMREPVAVMMPFWVEIK